MLAALAAPLLVYLVASPTPGECHDVSRRSFADATTLSHFGDPAAGTSYQAFGILVHIEATPGGQLAPKRKCEGVLLSSTVVLTALPCRPNDKRMSMIFKFHGEDIYVAYNDFTQAGRYFLITLGRAPKKQPSVYPFLSWYAKSQTLDGRYGIRDESVAGRKIYLSSWLAHKSALYNAELPSINSALQNCQFDVKDQLIALECAQLSVCNGATVLDGAAFFTFTKTSTKRIVSISGLVSLRSSGSHCKDAYAPNARGPYTAAVPNPPRCNDAYVCGNRFTEDDVRKILRKARTLDLAGVKLHDDYIPSGTRIGSFNMQGLEKFSSGRPYRNEQAETVRNVIEMADILALQEVGTQLTVPSSDQYIIFRDSVMNILPGRTLKAIDSFAFVYDSSKFSIVASSCVTVTSNRIVRCSFKNKAVTTASNTFTVFNVHLTNAYASARYTELNRIQTEIAAMTSNNEVILIAGDFNVGAGKKAPGGSTTKVFSDIREAMTILKDMTFLDHGATTYRENVYLDPTSKPLSESHFDRFAVSKNVRLMYTYYPELTSNAAQTIGTIHNGPVGEETPPGFTVPVKRRRISTLISTCPPIYHNYQLRDQNERNKYTHLELTACYPEGRRRNEPLLDRSRDLSDHLPVMFTHAYTKIATWNMRLYDPTINPSSPGDRSDFKDRKEIRKAAHFLTILNEFEIVAVQELSPTRRPKNVGNSIAAKAKRTTILTANKRWYWSETTPELGFAVNNEIYAKNCKDIDMTTAVDKDARPAFLCQFYEKNGKNNYDYIATLINVHVKNVHSSAATGEKYRVEANNNVLVDKQDAFLLGDFNAVFTNIKVKCIMTGHASLSYTKFDKFKRIDYVWKITEANKPGVSGCRVYNPEILRTVISQPDSMPVFPDRKSDNDMFSPAVQTKYRMKAFPVWASVSDHYPVFITFYVPT